MTALKYGNTISASFGYSPDRLQLASLSYGANGVSYLGLTYAYGTSGSNDGLISTITDGPEQGRTVSYTYDSLARLSTAVTLGATSYPKWGLQWAYDRYGNRTMQQVTYGTGVPSNSVAVSATTNQITGSPYAYDPSGNMTNDGFNTLLYDGENRATSASNSGASGTYTYDGRGLRVKKVAGTTTTVYIFSGSKVVAEYDNGAAPAAPSREYIYSGSTLLARIDSTGTRYFHKDLVSNRMVTDSTGHIVEQMGHYPYGESWYTTAGEKLLFTTYERDAESGNDYALARYYASRLGRFLSVDPLAGSTGDPQSLNRYVYARDLPNLVVDPSGTCGEFIEARRRKRRLEFELGGMGLLPGELEEADPGQDITSAYPIDCTEGGGGGGGSDDGLTADSIDQLNVGTVGDSIDPLNELSPPSCANSTAPICVESTLYPPGFGFSNPPLTNPYYNDPSNDPDLGPFGPIQVSSGGGGSTTWLQTKVFFQALGRNFIDEFKPDGCVAAFAEGADQADFLGALPPGQPIIDDAIKGTAATVAANYAATQALTVPLRSSVVRGILATGETAAAYVAPVYLLGLTVSGAIAEGKAIVNGTCH